MYAQNIILYGSSQEKNLERAYDIAIKHILGDSIGDIRHHILANTYPNFLLVKKEQNAGEISIEQIRSQIEFLSSKATLPLNKAVIIDCAEDLSRNAANAMLKTLEEKKTEDLIILTTDRLSSLLPTIRSRCLKINVFTDILSPDSYTEASKYIVSVLESKKRAIKQEFVGKITRFISTGCKNIPGFIRQVSQEELGNAREIVLLYSGYQLAKTKTVDMAAKFLKIQRMMILARNTHPDDQSLLAGCFILSV